MPTLSDLSGDEWLHLLKRTPGWDFQPTASSYHLTCGETVTEFPLDWDGLNAALRALLAYVAARQFGELPHVGTIEP